MRATVPGLIARGLVREGLPADTLGELNTAAVTLAKTADRAVLGCMNDMARHAGDAPGPGNPFRQVIINTHSPYVSLAG